MTPLEARNLLEIVARNAAGDNYSDSAIDEALMFACADFKLRTHWGSEYDEIDLLEDDPIGDFDDEVAGRILEAWVDDEPPMLITKHSQLRAYRKASSTTSTKPTVLAFLESAAAEFWPTPSENLTVSYFWLPAATTWVAGAPDVDIDGEEINLPDDMLRGIIRLGGKWALHMNEVEPPDFVERSRQEYMEFVARCSRPERAEREVQWSKPM